MKLIRYGAPGSERPGLIDNSGAVRDLSVVRSDITPSMLSEEFLPELASAADSLLVVPDPERIGACVPAPSKFICVGLNYHAHIREVGASAPPEPVIFMKAPSAVSGPYDDVVLPRRAMATDWEVELGVVIGTRASNVTVDQAMSYIAGYCIVNDISERAWQLEGTGQWVKGKSADTFAPMGPWLVTRDEIPDPQQLSLHLSVNGESQQQGNTADMVFGVAHLVSYISGFMSLLPGDVISTGTPPGVGMGKRPPRYLSAGDVIEATISGLGTQRQRVVSAPAEGKFY